MAGVSEKSNVLKSDLKESSEGFCQRGRGRSCNVEGPKTKKARDQVSYEESGG